MRDNDFEKVFETFGQPVYRLMLSRTGDVETSRDICQQTFLLLYEKKPSFKDKNQLRVWLIRTALKLLSNERKRGAGALTLPLEESGEIAVTDELSFEFCDVLSRLDEKYRDVTVLYYIEDMSVSAIAKSLGLSAGAVKSRLMRARDILKKIYKEEIL